MKDSDEIGKAWNMGPILKLFVTLVFCAAAFFIWLVQPDRNLLRDLAQDMEAMAFNEVEKRMGELGFRSQTLTYFALTDRFSRGDGSHPMVFMSSEIRQRLLKLCPVECEMTTSEKREEVPLLGMDRSYKFHSVITDAGKTEVLPDHAFWIMYLP